MALDLEIESFSFPTSGSLLSDSRLRVEPGERLAILGGSGSGKTLLMTLLAGLHPEPLGGRLSGSITLDGKPPQDYAPTDLLGKVGFMGSDPRLFLTGFCRSVREEVAWSLLAMGQPISQVEVRVKEVLERLGISELSGFNPAELSGGEQQLVALASVLVRQPDFLLLDQPADSLDVSARARFLDALATERAKSSLAIVWASSQLGGLDDFDKVAFLPSDPAVGGVRTVVFARNQLPKEVLGEQTVEAFLGSEPVRPVPNEKGMESIQLGLRKVSYRHPGASHETLTGVDLTLTSPGDGVVGVFGRNGAGKTSLMRLLRGLVAPHAGEVILEGRSLERTPVGSLVGRLSHCFQDTASMFFQTRVDSELLAIGEILGKSEAEARQRLEEALDFFDLAGVRADHPQTLPASKAALLGLACSWYSEARFHFLDEPTASLDGHGLGILDRALTELVASGSTIIVVSHHLDWLEQRSHRLIALERGRVVMDALAEEVVSEGGVSEKFSQLAAHQ